MDERRKEKPLLHSLLSQGDRLELKMLGGEEPRLLPPAGASPPPCSSNQFGGGTGTSMSVLVSGCLAGKAPQICRAGSSSDPNSTATGTGSCCALSPWAASFKNPVLGAWIYGFSLIRLEVLHFPLQALQFQLPISPISFIALISGPSLAILTGFVNHPGRVFLPWPLRRAGNTGLQCLGFSDVNVYVLAASQLFQACFQAVEA